MKVQLDCGDDLEK